MGRERQNCRVVGHGREGDGRGGRGSKLMGRGREGNERAAKCQHKGRDGWKGLRNDGKGIRK